jgi:NAD(P)-dependent dehydrogenase (short-subunit alcohol dehydrogenase family)
MEILITGANRGLGLALTARFLDLGHRVHAISRESGPDLPRFKERHPAELYTYRGDVTDEASIEAALNEIGHRCQHLDIVVNNAGLRLEATGPELGEIDPGVFGPTFDVNAVGPLVVCKHALPLIRQGQAKLVANISSEAGAIGIARRTVEYAYCMSKAAINMGSKLLHNALVDEGIKVLAIHPGWFSSDMGGPHAPITPEEAAQQVAALLLTPPSLDGPIFVDARGVEMDW